MFLVQHLSIQPDMEQSGQSGHKYFFLSLIREISQHIQVKLLILFNALICLCWVCLDVYNNIKSVFVTTLSQSLRLRPVSGVGQHRSQWEPGKQCGL